MDTLIKIPPKYDMDKFPGYEKLFSDAWDLIHDEDYNDIQG